MGAPNLASWFLTTRRCFLLSVSIPSPSLLCPFLSLSGSQMTSLAGLVNRRWVCCCWLSLVQLQERYWTPVISRLTQKPTSFTPNGWVFASDKLLNSKRTKCQRQSVCQGGLKGSSWLECLKGIPRSSGSALLFSNTERVRHRRQVCSRRAVASSVSAASGSQSQIGN